MSFLKNLQKIALTPSTAIGNIIGKAIAPNTFVPQKTEKLVQTGFGKVLSSSIIGVGAGLVAVSPIPSAIATKYASAGLTTKIVAPFVAPAVITGGTKLLAEKPQVLVDIPKKTIKGSLDLAKLTGDPSVKNVVDYVKANPEVSTVIGAGALYLGGKTLLNIAPVASALRSGEATQEQTKAIKEQTDVLKSATAPIIQQVAVQEPQKVIIEQIPAPLPLATTQSPSSLPTASGGTPIKKKKKAKKKAKKKPKKKAKKKAKKKPKKKAKKKAKKKPKKKAKKKKSIKRRNRK